MFSTLKILYIMTILSPYRTDVDQFLLAPLRICRGLLKKLHL